MKRRLKNTKNKMNSKIYKMMNTSFLTKVMAFILVLSQICPAYALNIFDAVDGASGTILDRITITMDKTVFPIAAVLLIFLAAINSTNQKMSDIIKMAGKILFISFVLLNCLNLVFNTFYWIIGLLGGSASIGSGVTGSEIVE